MLNRFGLVLVLWLALAGVAQGAIVNVTRADDPVGGTCLPTSCSLRQAVDFAIEGDTIKLGAQRYSLTQGTQLTLARSIGIEGASRATTTIDGIGNIDTFFKTDRILRVQPSAVVTISNLTFHGGRDGKDENFGSCSPCSTITANGGGAIFNAGELTLVRVGFEDNLGSPVGGAIGNNGNLVVNDSEFRGNGAAFGGALFSRNGVVQLNRVTLHANTNSARGGAAYLLGGSMLIRNSTVTGNGQSSSLGGGLVNAGGTLTLTNVTAADNVRGNLMRLQGAAGTAVENSLLGGCVPGGQVFSDFATIAPIQTDLGYNLDVEDTCGLTEPTRVVGDNARLAPVNANDGDTPTMALLGESPAIDRIPLANCTASDQRGVTREGGLCDIGAFEARQLGQPTVTTDGVAEVSQDQASFVATVGLAGEPGKLSFLWGLAADAVDTPTPGLGVGTTSPVTRSETVFGLPAGTTIFYRAVAENASGTTLGAIKSFSTAGPVPSILDLRPGAVTATSVQLRFGLDPQGSSTSYRITFDDGAGHSGELPPTGIGVDPQQVEREVTGLHPDTGYRFQVIATNGSGSTALDDGIIDVRTLAAEATATATPTVTATPSATTVPSVTPTPTPTATATPTPQPLPGKEVVVAPAGGTVLVKLPGAKTFVALKAGQAVPYGAQIDARKGRVRLTSIPKAGAPPETAVFYDGLFKVSYRGGITTLTLTEPLAACPKKKGRASASAKKAKQRKLWGDGKGAFRTSGKYSAATVRGTKWLVQDSCAGTLTRVVAGVVEVRHGKKQIVLRAGKRYLAKPKR